VPAPAARAGLRRLRRPSPALATRGRPRRSWPPSPPVPVSAACAGSRRPRRPGPPPPPVPPPAGRAAPAGR